MKGKPFALIGVNSDSSTEVAKKAVADNGLNWRSFQNELPDGSSISDAWCVEGWPTIVVLDADMKIHYRGHSGDAAIEVARELVSALEARG